MVTRWQASTAASDGAVFSRRCLELSRLQVDAFFERKIGFIRPHRYTRNVIGLSVCLSVFAVHERELSENG